MFSKQVLGGGAVLDAALIAATEYFSWPGELYYVWASLALIWGFIVLFKSN